MVFEHPGEAFIGSWSQPGDVESVRTSFSDFAPLVHKLLQLVDSCLEWSLARVPEIPTWRSQDGTILLIGDAAHAPTPHLAQGSAMCMEDAAVIAKCLSCISIKEDIPKATFAFQEIRKPRTEKVQQASWEMQTFWSLPDGPQQEARDRKLRGEPAKDIQAVSEGQKSRGPATPSWLIDYDAIEDVTSTVSYCLYNIANYGQARQYLKANGLLL